MVLEGQVVFGDPVFVADGDETLDQVLQLPDVAWPLVLLERGQRFVGDPVDVLAELGAVAIPEQAGQLRQIVDPLPQRRQLDRDDVDPVEQILAEGACLDSLFQVCVRRDDQSEVGPVSAC